MAEEDGKDADDAGQGAAEQQGPREGGGADAGTAGAPAGRVGRRLGGGSGPGSAAAGSAAGEDGAVMAELTEVDVAGRRPRGAASVDNAAWVLWEARRRAAAMRPAALAALLGKGAVPAEKMALAVSRAAAVKVAPLAWRARQQQPGGGEGAAGGAGSAGRGAAGAGIGRALSGAGRSLGGRVVQGWGQGREVRAPSPIVESPPRRGREPGADSGRGASGGRAGFTEGGLSPAGRRARGARRGAPAGAGPVSAASPSPHPPRDRAGPARKPHRGGSGSRGAADSPSDAAAPRIEPRGGKAPAARRMPVEGGRTAAGTSGRASANLPEGSARPQRGGQERGKARVRAAERSSSDVSEAPAGAGRGHSREQAGANPARAGMPTSRAERAEREARSRASHDRIRRELSSEPTDGPAPSSPQPHLPAIGRRKASSGGRGGAGGPASRAARSGAGREGARDQRRAPARGGGGAAGADRGRRRAPEDVAAENAAVAMAIAASFQEAVAEAEAAGDSKAADLARAEAAEASEAARQAQEMADAVAAAALNSRLNRGLGGSSAAGVSRLHAGHRAAGPPAAAGERRPARTAHAAGGSGRAPRPRQGLAAAGRASVARGAAAASSRGQSDGPTAAATRRPGGSARSLSTRPAGMRSASGRQLGREV